MAVRKRTWIGLAALVVVVLAAVALVWFQPQRLLYDSTVDEGLPSAGATTEPVEVSSGTFVSHAHETVGTVRVLELPDGRFVVRLEGFETTNGPDLFVWLSGSPAGGDEAALDDEYVDLGRLKGNIGDQNYAVPEGVDPTEWTSVVIWCLRFSTSFGAADLAPAAA